MSDLSGQDPTISQDPLNYAPRWLREKPDQRLPQSIEPRIEREVRKTEPVTRTQLRAPNPALDRQLESAVYESLRHSLDPHVMPEPPAFGSGGRNRSMAGFASRLVVAIGVSAVVALLFVIMAPSSRQANSGASLATTIEQFSAAVARNAQADDAAKPALSEFKGLLAASSDGAQQAASPRSTEPLLQQFLVWREKAGPNDPPQ